jgi:SAM-dependent methyltransferase
LPVYRSRTAVEIVRGIKAFLNLEAGLTRGELPDPGRELEAAWTRLRRQQQRLQRKRTRPTEREVTKRSVVSEDRSAANGKRPKGFRGVREELAYRYLAGSGLEIGALHQALPVPPGVTVRYVDRMTVEQLREQYPELAGYDLMPVDIVDDGETLPSVSDASVDFVIANHMMEHCQDPIGSLENHLRVLKPDGILYLSVPDKRFTFDRDRPVTPLEHMIRDYEEGPAWSKDSHFEEWARLMEKRPEEAVLTRARELAEIDFSIHFHVWTQTEFLQLLLYCQNDLRFPFEIELFQKNDTEIVSILRKLPTTA